MNISSNMYNDFFKEQYKEQMKNLKIQKDSLSKIMQSNSQKTKKDSKARKGRAVFVTGATKKEDIKKLKNILKQKISEIQFSEDDDKLKTMKVNLLQQKLNALERILCQIEDKEKAKLEKTPKKNNKNKKIESLYLSKEDLTLNGGNQKAIENKISQSYNNEPKIDLTTEPSDNINVDSEQPTVDLGI